MPKPRLEWTLGDVFRKIRRTRRLTQEQVAADAEINRSTVTEIETDKVNPDIETQKRFARALGVTLADVYTYIEDVNLLADLTPAGQAAVREFAAETRLRHGRGGSGSPTSGDLDDGPPEATRKSSGQ